MALGTNIEYKARALFQAALDEKSAKQVEDRFVKLSKEASEMSREEFVRAFGSLGQEINNALTKLKLPQINMENLIKLPQVEAFSKLGAEFGTRFAEGFQGAVGGMDATSQIAALEARKAELNQRSSKLNNRYDKYERLSDLSSMDYSEFKPLAAESNLDEQAERIMGEFVQAENALNELTSGTKEYNTALIKALEAAENLYRMSHTLNQNKGAVKDKSILSDYDALSLSEITNDVFDAADVDFSKYFRGFGEYYMKQSKAIKLELQDIDAQIEALHNSNPEIINESKAQSALKTLQEIEAAYQRISYKTGQNKGQLKNPDQITSALNYVPGTESLAKLKNAYTKAEPERWEQQYAALVKFVREYEAYVNMMNAETDSHQRSKMKERLGQYTELYQQLQPMAANAENMLQNILNMASKTPLVGMGGDGTGTGTGTGDGTGTSATQEEVENSNKLAEVLQRVEAAYKELDALSNDPWNIKNEEEVNRILQERLAIIQRVGAENLKAHNPEWYSNVEYINNEYSGRLDSFAESKDDAIYDQLDENFGYNNEIIESSQNLEVLLAKRRELMQGIHFDAEQEYAEQEQINQSIERRIALMKQLEPLVANGSITNDQMEEMVFEQGNLDERRNMLDGIQQDLFNLDSDSIDDAQFMLDQYEKIMVETASGKKLTLGPEMSEADWKAFMRMDIEKAKSIEFTRKEIQAHQENTAAINAETQAQEKLNGSETQNPSAQDDSGVHNANADAVNSENEALQQQKKIINDVVAAKEGLKASQTKLGVTDGTSWFGESTLDTVKEKQATLKTYLQELTQIEAQEKKNGTLTEAEVARRRELVNLVQEMSLSVRYKDGSFYSTSNFGNHDQDLSTQIEQLNQVLSLRKQIALGYYNTGTYGTFADTFSGEGVTNLINFGSMEGIDAFDSSIVGQMAREYQMLHEQMLRCMLVGEEVPKSTLDRMKWFESVDASQIETLLPKLTELQQKINEIQSKEGLTSLMSGQDDSYYDEKIKDLTTLISLQKEYSTLGGPLSNTLFGFDFNKTSDELQGYVKQLTALKQGSQDSAKLKQAFPDTNLRGTPDLASVVDDLQMGSITYDEAVAKVTQLIAAQKQLNDEKAKEPPPVDDTPKLQDENAKLDEQNGKLKENINLKTQANGQGVVTGGTGTGTGGTETPTQTVPDGATTAEVGELEAVRAKVQEVTNAVNMKNKAFYNEGQIVGQTVGKENAALISLKSNIDTITNAVNTKTQAFIKEEMAVRQSVGKENAALISLQGNVNNVTSGLSGALGNLQGMRMPNLSNATSPTNITNESQALSNLRIRIDEVTAAVRTKTTAFVQEEMAVRQSVGNEINALIRLLQNVNNVNTAISTLSQGLNNTLNNAGAFNGINLNVNATVDLTAIETTLANILTAIPNAGTNVQNNNAGGQGGGGNGGQGGNRGDLAGRITVQSSMLDNFEAKLMDIGQLTPNVQNQIDQLRTALNNVADAPGLTVWMNQFRTMRTDMNTAGIISDLDTLGQMAKRLGELRAKSTQAASAEERASWDALIQQQEAAMQHMQQGVDVDQGWLDNRALEAYNRSMEKYNDQMEKARAKERKTAITSAFNEEIKTSIKRAGLSKGESSANKAFDTLVSAGQIQGISPEQQANLDAYRGKIEALRNTIDSFPQGGPASEAQKNQLIAQRLEVDAYTKEIQELIANYERLSGENATILGTSSLGLGASADAYQQELTQTIMAQTQGRAVVKSYDAETRTLTYTLKTGKGEFTQYAASVRQADGALVSVRGTTTKAMGVFESIGKKIKEYSYYFTGSMMIYRVIAWVREGITAVKEIDTALTELKKVTDETEESYDKFLDTAAKTASKVGSTIKDVVSSTADWARLNI